MFTASAGGYAATRFNPKAVLLGGAVVWSTFTLLTPAMAGNLPALLATRAAMGFGEGVTFPAISNLFAKCASLPLILVCWLATLVEQLYQSRPQRVLLTLGCAR